MGAQGLPSSFDEEVLDLVARIPAGCAMSYGAVAQAIGAGGPRQVGRTMSEFGSGVPWWRVVRADGTPAPQVAAEALRRLRRDHTPLTASGERVDWRHAAWSPSNPS